jgi:hypothetical protein
MAANFSISNNKLTVDVIQVGDTLVEFVNVTLDKFAVLGVSGTGLCSSFDPSNNTLFLASVTVGNEIFRGVTLRLDTVSGLSTNGSAPVLPGKQVVNINDIVTNTANTGKATVDASSGSYMFFDDILQKGWAGNVAHDVIINNFGADDAVYFDGNGINGAASTSELYFLRHDAGSSNVIAMAKPASSTSGLTYSQVTLIGVGSNGGYFPSLNDFNGSATGDIYLGLP